MFYFHQDFQKNLRKAIDRLYDRDKRLELLPKDFWLVEKEMATRLQDVNPEKLASIVNLTIL